uniref:Uncharacterized protein n=1 Tax=Trichogramma kaykai TaxID=54128 RepID=A0ABD2X804_9HYME
MAERATAYTLLIYSALAFFATRENSFSLSFEFDNRYLNSPTRCSWYEYRPGDNSLRGSRDIMATLFPWVADSMHQV